MLSKIISNAFMALKNKEEITGFSPNISNNLLNVMDLILLNINFGFGLKLVFCLYFEHDIYVVSNDVHIINIESMCNINN